MEALRIIHRDSVTADIQVDVAFEQRRRDARDGAVAVVTTDLERILAASMCRHQKKITQGRSTRTQNDHAALAPALAAPKLLFNPARPIFVPIRPNSFLYSVCVCREPSIDLISATDTARVSQLIEALRDTVVHGVLHDSDICETHALKPRTRKLQDFVRAMATSNLDDTDVPIPVLDYLATRMLDMRVLIITCGRAASLSSVTRIRSSTLNPDSSTRCLVYCKGERTYASSDDFEACKYMYAQALSNDIAKISRYQTTYNGESCVSNNGESFVDGLDDDTLATWSHAVVEALLILEIHQDSARALGKALAESTASKRSRAKKAIEARRAELASCLIDCVGRVRAHS